MRRFGCAIADLAARQDRIARSAQERTWLLWLGSLAVGLLLLCLLGWRMPRTQRRSAVADQARAMERRGEERLHALVRHSSDVVAVVDGSSQVRWLAESVPRTLGFDAAEPVGGRLIDLVHPDDAVPSARFLEKAALNEG